MPFERTVLQPASRRLTGRDKHDSASYEPLGAGYNFAFIPNFVLPNSGEYECIKTANGAKK